MKVSELLNTKLGGIVSAPIAGLVNSARSAGSSAAAASTMNSSAKMISSIIDRASGIADDNSARMVQNAREANEFSANQAAIARQFNAAEAAKNREWQQYMSNTAHQREVADLKAAGLNPVLSAMGGNGAAVTSGASASATAPAGQKADTDISASSSLVNLLSSVLAAQTQLQVSTNSARAAEAVADKYTAMEHLVATMSNATQRYGIRTSAETSRYATDVSSWTSMSIAEKQAAVNKYAAELSSAASRYGAYMSWEAATSIARNQLEYQASHPNNMYQVIDSLLQGAGSSPLDIGGTIKSGASSALDALKDLFTIKHESTKKPPSLNGSGRSF